MEALVIPRIIHQLWINPETFEENDLPVEIEMRCGVWKALHPMFLHKLWSLEQVLAIGDEISGQRVRSAIQACRFPSAKADIARLVLLREFGGFWVDLKLVPHHAFLPDLINHDLVLTEHFPKENLPEPNGFLCNGFIGTTPRSGYIERLLDQILSNVENRMQGSIFAVTGPISYMAVADAMRRLTGALGAVCVLPHAETWNKRFSIGEAFYDKNHSRHWSRREKEEPIYAD